MLDHWFSAIYENHVINFKFCAQSNKQFNHKCWIVTKDGERLFVDTDTMIFGEHNHLERKLNEKTISRL